MKWCYLLITSQKQLLKFLVYVVYVDDNSELSVIWPILFAAIIQNFEIAGIASVPNLQTV